MRTLRNRAIGLLASLAVLLGLAGTAHAIAVSFVWTGSNAAAPTGIGTSSIGNLLPGDTATLDLLVSDPGSVGVSLAAVTVGFDNSVLFALSSTVCPGPPAVGNLAPGLCGTGPFLTPIVNPTTNVINNPLGQVQTITASGIPGPVGQTFTLAQIVFSAVGAGTSFGGAVYLLPDGIVDNAFNPPVFPPGSATATVVPVPEPGTLALMALALGALALAGRRR